MLPVTEFYCESDILSLLFKILFPVQNPEKSNIFIIVIDSLAGET